MQETTKSKMNVFIIIGIFIAVLVAGYLYITRDQSSPDLLVSTPTDAIASPVDGAFLAALLELKQHNLDKSLFDTKAWKSLRDFSKPLAPQDKYRPNPFAPLGATSTSERF